MILFIYTDGDSGLYNPKTGQAYKEYIKGTSEYALIITPEDIETFAENWYTRKYKQSDKFVDVVDFIIPDVIFALNNGIEDIFYNGNYHLKTVDECNFYRI